MDRIQSDIGFRPVFRDEQSKRVDNKPINQLVNETNGKRYIDLEDLKGFLDSVAFRSEGFSGPEVIEFLKHRIDVMMSGQDDRCCYEVIRL
jgi:hypothetical protein